MSSRLGPTLARLAAGLLVASAAHAQIPASPVHSARPDPAVQEAAAARQREILAHPEQYGTNCCQILQVPASAFTVIDAAADGTMSEGTGTGYATLNPGSFFTRVWAPLTLPTGVVIDFLDLYYYDTDPVGDICVDIWGFSGTTSPATTVLATTCSSGNAGFGYASNTTSITVKNSVISGGYQYALVVYEDAASPNQQFRGVDLWWNRQVSPAPAVATFNDVPTNHPFFQFVEALSASGITAGCQTSPPLFCPDAPLTRKQMAAFLAKALGLYWPL
jgi:hypothetical protein